MRIFFRLLLESLRFAFNALAENPLRTILSLLGVTVGIFSIIAVLTVVDGLKISILRSFSFLGDRVVYVQKFPFSFDGNPDYPWWKYMQRPAPTLDECEFLEKNMNYAAGVCMFDVRGNQTIKSENNSISGVAVMGTTYGRNRVVDIPIVAGRYFSLQECNKGAQVALIGDNFVKELFGGEEPIGKEIKVKGLKYKVIGVMERQGSNLLDAPSNDNLCIIPFVSYVKIFASKTRGVNPIIAVKGLEADEGLQEMLGEMQGLLRRKRALKPLEEDNFALNRTEALADFTDSLIGVLKVAGWFIGSFAILVGGFGIANIMFVSVKERTSLIGIQKSLGAKNYFILFQFLFEAIFLSVLGGSVGLILVALLNFLSSETFEIVLSYQNVSLGIFLASFIGIVSGIVPAINAARLDPVEAIRAK